MVFQGCLKWSSHLLGGVSAEIMHRDCAFAPSSSEVAVVVLVLLFLVHNLPPAVYVGTYYQSLMVSLYLLLQEKV